MSLAWMPPQSNRSAGDPITWLLRIAVLTLLLWGALLIMHIASTPAPPRYTTVRGGPWAVERHSLPHGGILR
jgi:hypothetical protein